MPTRADSHTIKEWTFVDVFRTEHPLVVLTLLQLPFVNTFRIDDWDSLGGLLSVVVVVAF